MRKTLLVTKALADLQRLRILMMLARGELCVCQIVKMLALATSTVSKHLSILENAGLLISRKEGKWVHYSLSKDPFVKPVIIWLRKALQNDADIEKDAAALKKLSLASGSNCADAKAVPKKGKNK